MRQQHLADSVLNRIMNFMDDLDAPAPVAQGAAIDLALAAPVPEMPPADGIAEALVAKGLKLEPIP